MNTVPDDPVGCIVVESQVNIRLRNEPGGPPELGHHRLVGSHGVEVGHGGVAASAAEGVVVVLIENADKRNRNAIKMQQNALNAEKTHKNA